MRLIRTARIAIAVAVFLIAVASCMGDSHPIDPQNVVRIRIVNGVEQSWGSGAYLGERVVLTCAHLFRDGPAIEGDVWFGDGSRHRFICRQINHTWDQAVLELDSTPKAKGLPLARSNPDVGDLVYAYGYGAGNRVMVTSGIVKQYSGPGNNPTDWVEMTGRVDQGSSGGPICNAAGEVIGNLWGVGQAARGAFQTIGVMTGRTRRFLLPWNARLEAHAISQGWPPGGS